MVLVWALDEGLCSCLHVRAVDKSHGGVVVGPNDNICGGDVVSVGEIERDAADPRCAVGSSVPTWAPPVIPTRGMALPL